MTWRLDLVISAMAFWFFPTHNTGCSDDKYTLFLWNWNWSLTRKLHLWVDVYKPIHFIPLQLQNMIVWMTREAWPVGICVCGIWLVFRKAKLYFPSIFSWMYAKLTSLASITCLKSACCNNSINILCSVSLWGIYYVVSDFIWEAVVSFLVLNSSGWYPFIWFNTHSPIVILYNSVIPIISKALLSPHVSHTRLWNESQWPWSPCQFRHNNYTLFISWFRSSLTLDGL